VLKKLIYKGISSITKLLTNIALTFLLPKVFLLKLSKMLSFFSKYKYIAITLSILSVIIVSSIYSILKPVPSLKVFQPAHFNSELVDSTLQHIKKYHTIKDFKLTNQYGKIITQKEYEGKIYIANFFFTTCLDICPIMTDHMRQIQEKTKHDKEIMLLSHTVIPKIDTVAQLHRYALEKKVDSSKWNLVTGSKKELYRLARKSYMAVKDLPKGEEYQMIHTENFILIDKKRRIRGIYDGTKPEEIERVLNEIELLKKEYN